MSTSLHWELQTVLDFFLSQPSLEAVIAYQPAAAAQERLSHLLELSRAGRLSADDKAELDEALAIGMFVNLLRARAYEKLSANVAHP